MLTLIIGLCSQICNTTYIIHVFVYDNNEHCMPSDNNLVIVCLRGPLTGKTKKDDGKTGYISQCNKDRCFDCQTKNIFDSNN